MIMKIKKISDICAKILRDMELLYDVDKDVFDNYKVYQKMFFDVHINEFISGERYIYSDNPAQLFLDNINNIKTGLIKKITSEPEMKDFFVDKLTKVNQYKIDNKFHSLLEEVELAKEAMGEDDFRYREMKRQLR